MRKILIDKGMEIEVENFCTNLFSGRRKDFEKPKTKLEKLEKECLPIKHKKYKEYVRKIIDEYDDIIKAKPLKMRSLINEFENILPYNFLQAKIPHKKIEFYKSVVTALRFDDLRDEEFRKHQITSPIKVCVYCNAQLTIAFETNYYDQKEKKNVKEYKAKLELDHFYPKSKYPFLSTSYFNLYPVCGNCNRSKSFNPALFELYTESKNEALNVFNFWIDDDSIIKYWVDNNNEHIKVYFETQNGDTALFENHNKTFDIQGIYNTQKDLAEELLHKAKAYSEAYKTNLLDTFESLFPDKALINRLVIGNYDKSEDIHKRPMSKFTQDISRQLGLIPKR